MKIIKSIAWFLICAVGQLPVTTYAQNPLIIFVESQPNSTALHDEVANAVAAICPNLGGFGQAPGPQRDLFLRCNEMITTACDLNGLADPATGMLLPCPGRNPGNIRPGALGGFAAGLGRGATQQQLTDNAGYQRTIFEYSGANECITARRCQRSSRWSG